MYRLENSSATSITTILLLQAKAIENKTKYELKQNMTLEKIKKKYNYENDKGRRTKTT